MGDEVLARKSPLVAVVQAGVDERALHPLAVDRLGGLIGMLLDDREQVAEQALLSRRQLRARNRGVSSRIADLVDRGTLGGNDRRLGRSAGGRQVSARPAGTVAAATARRVGTAATDRSAQPIGRWFALLRYRFPSSYRWA
jgi:hypothetical protein